MKFDHNKNRSVSALLLLSMLAAGLSSCGDTSGDTGTVTDNTAATEAVTEAVTEDPALRDSLPEIDLGGYQYRMAILHDVQQYFLQQPGADACHVF